MAYDAQRIASILRECDGHGHISICFWCEWVAEMRAGTDRG